MQVSMQIIIIIIHLFRNSVFIYAVYEYANIFIAWPNCRAGFCSICTGGCIHHEMDMKI